LSVALRSQSLGSVTAALAELLGFRGRAFLTSSACAASTQGLALAAQWLAQGKVKRVLVGGAEVLCNLTLEGFRSMQLVSPLNSTPFDVNRKGINLSEAAAFVCLEPEATATAKPLAHLSGFGLSTDGYHMTAPHPEGRGIFEAMQAALKSAGLSTQDISWVHAHGTGSRHNDQAEGSAIARLFTDGAGRAIIDGPWTSSTKWVHGHALGASGALETTLCVHALLQQTILKTTGLKDPDPAIGLRHPTASAPARLRHILKTTLGFGGSNAALVLSQAGAR
ncbi:MAG: beta-ketoacyl-[acyl-carrier-protein] synthase II, partial [Deltaproteobacteria bacterium]|nr:beta-ketoacyl-[acyl-carrier-protein] synthase II [Deltaproteobacteria bacterium]